MSLPQDLPLDEDELTPVRLWAILDQPTRALAARAMFTGDRQKRDQANHAIALALRFRDAGVRKLSLDRRVDYLARVVRADHALASSLLMALHLDCRQELLVGFLNELQIPNQDGLIPEDYELAPVAGRHAQAGDRQAPRTLRRSRGRSLLGQPSGARPRGLGRTGRVPSRMRTRTRTCCWSVPR